MAIVEDRVVRPIGTFELVQALRDQETADAVACHESKLALEEIEAAKRRELINHQQEPLPPPVGIQALGQSTSDLVEDAAHQRVCAGNVGGRDHQIQSNEATPADQ